MSTNINLADKKNPEDSRKDKAKKLKGISFAILLTTAFLAVVIFALDYRFSASYVRKQQADLLNELTPYADKSAKIFIVNSKLTDISQILSNRKKYNETVDQIVRSNSGGAVIEDFKIDDTGIEMTVSSSSLEPIDQFLNSLLELADKKTVSSITLKSLSLEAGSYVVELIII